MNALFSILILSFTFSHLAYSQQNLPISDFGTAGLSGWSTEEFSGKTQYSIIEINNISILKAVSHASASGLGKELQIDLKNTPYINWSWKIDNRLQGLQEKTKNGDDYSARIYVIINGGWLPWNTLSLNYAWSSNQMIGTTWDNAFFIDNAKMIAIQGKNSQIETWYSEKRNVFTDLIAQFGDKGSASKNEDAYRYIDAIAIMTDTDNSQLNATAYYRNIFFSAD